MTVLFRKEQLTLNILKTKIMRKLFRLKNLLLMVILTAFTVSCEQNDDSAGDQLNIVETAQATDALSSLVSALATADQNENSDLIGTLSGQGPFTVFAPTNDAFTALLGALDGFDSLEDFDTDEERALLGSILQYHVVAGVAARAADLSDGQEITTVQGEAITVRLDGGVFIDDATEMNAEVVIADVEASNGVVHVVNKVLLPQAIIDAINDGMDNDPGTLVDIVVATESLSILEAAVIKAGLAETLSSEGPFTVFAPTDDAFVSLLDILGDDYNSLDDFDTAEEMALLKDILLYHVIPAQVLAADLAPGAVGTALADNNVEIIAADGTFVIGDASDVNANITATDIIASNGVAHTIDKVLLPQAAIDFVNTLNLQTIVEIAIATDDLSLLVGALQQADAGLVEVLSGAGPFTVFAPTNDAFVGLLDALGNDFNSLADFDTDEEKALLVKVLTYHVVSGAAAFSTDLQDGQQIETVQGENVGINIKDGVVHVEDATAENATVVIADVEASNGVVHVINKVLLPQEVLDILNPPVPNIVQLAQATPDLSILVDALVKVDNDAGLIAALSGTGPFTVFAPNNEAFIGLLDDLGPDYNSLDDFDTQAEIDLLITILTYHVAADLRLDVRDFVDGELITTIQGETLTQLKGPVQGGTRTAIDDKSAFHANFRAVNLEASNGIVHVVSRVLLPQEVLDALPQLN